MRLWNASSIGDVIFIVTIFISYHQVFMETIKLNKLHKLQTGKTQVITSL